MGLVDKVKGIADKVRTTVAQAIAPKQEPKKITIYEAFTLLIKNFPIITVGLDSRVEGVVLPDALMNLDEVQLQYGMNLVRPIPDLNIGSDGISATLSFNRKPFKTFVPWKAVMWMRPGNPNPVGPAGGAPNLIALKGGKYDEKVANEQSYAMAA